MATLREEASRNAWKKAMHRTIAMSTALRAVRPLLLLAVLLMTCAQRTFAGCDGAPPLTHRFDVSRISQHIRVLASDEFAGRSPASRGEAKTIAYISKQFSDLGLKPAGDHQRWTQAVPLRKFDLSERVTFRISASGASYVPAYRDAVIVTSLTGDRHVALEGVPLVFVGYGVAAPELDWDDFKGIDLRGKAAVFLVNDPDFESPADGRFGGSAMTYYGRWRYKVEEAARRGAVAALIVHETGPAGYGWATVRNSWGASQFDIVRADPGKSHPLVEGWLHRDAAIHLFHLAGLDLDALKKRAMRSDFAPVELNSKLTVQADVSMKQVVSHNVIAKLPGRAQADESVVYSAHWDHVGIGQADDTGDRIYNGAVDNATGVAGLLELARAFAGDPPNSRSVYFAAFTAEEMGILGSEYYVLHPLTTLERMAAVFNMDVLGINGPACDLAIAGIEKSSIEEALTVALTRQGRTMVPDAHPQAGYFYRSDHFSFAKRGVPAVMLVSGEMLYQGGIASGRAAKEDYVARRYHQPADEWSPDWDLRGVAIDLDALYEVGRGIANSTDWPHWVTNSSFKYVRDQSAHLRER